MSFLAAAAIGAGGAIIGSGINAYASGKASNQQAEMGRAALGQLNSLFQQGMGLVKPFVDFGAGGMDSLKNFLDPSASGMPLNTLLKLLTPGGNMTDTLSQIPGFKFAQDWGQKAVENIGSTHGFGGNTLKAGADYATGTAQQGFGGLVGNLLSLFGSGAGAMQNRVNGGAGAAASAFGNATQTGATTGATLTGIGNANAAGTLGTSNALAGGVTGGANSVTNAMLLSKLLPAGAGGAAGAGGGIYTGDNAALSPTNTAFAYGR